jgi:hypothetical protein
MRRALRFLAVTGVLVLLGPASSLLPALLGSGAACASAAGAGHAALVVDTASQTIRLCVTLDAASVSGLHLIELAHAQHGLQYRLGFGGLAVCQLAGVGPSGADCFGSYPDFWGMWIGDGSGGWRWSGSGAGSVHVSDGGIQAWTWGPGDNGATHPLPSRATEVSVCGASAPTTPPPTHTSPPSTVPSSGHTASATASSRPSRAPSRTPGAPTATVQPDPSPYVAPVAAAGPGGASGSGSPAGIPLAIAGVLALGLAGWMRMRGNRARGRR